MGDIPTSNDVARLAGVTQSTVSYALSGKGRISQETRDRVLRAAKTLNYQPNAGAQALRSRRSRVIGLMFPVHEDESSAARLRFLTAMVAACREHGYDAIVVTADEGQSGLRRLADTALCDGLLVFQVKNQEPLADIAPTLRVPTVFVGVPDNHEGIVCVARDFGSAGRMCMAQLVAAGHREVAVLTPGDEYASSLNYHRRFMRGLAAEAEGAPVALVERGAGKAFIDLHEAVGEILAGQDCRGALVAGPSVDPLDLMSSLALHGRLPGRDLSVIGIADDTHDQPVFREQRIAVADMNVTPLAQRSLMRLMGLIEGGDGALEPGAVDLIVPTWRPGDTVLGDHPRP